MALVNLSLKEREHFQRNSNKFLKLNTNKTGIPIKRYHQSRVLFGYIKTKILTLVILYLRTFLCTLLLPLLTLSGCTCALSHMSNVS